MLWCWFQIEILDILGDELRSPGTEEGRHGKERVVVKIVGESSYSRLKGILKSDKKLESFN